MCSISAEYSEQPVHNSMNNPSVCVLILEYTPATVIKSVMFQCRKSTFYCWMFLLLSAWNAWRFTLVSLCTYSNIAHNAHNVWAHIIVTVVSISNFKINTQSDNGICLHVSASLLNCFRGLAIQFVLPLHINIIEDLYNCLNTTTKHSNGQQQLSAHVCFFISIV